MLRAVVFLVPIEPISRYACTSRAHHIPYYSIEYCPHTCICITSRCNLQPAVNSHMRLAIQSDPHSSPEPLQTTTQLDRGLDRTARINQSTSIHIQSTSKPISAHPVRTAAKRKRGPSVSPPQTQPTTDFKNNLSSTVSITTRGAPSKDVQTVTIHQPILASRSPYLARLATNSPNSEVKLLDLDSDAFSMFAAWLYGSKIDFDVGDGSEPFADPGDVLASVLECYVLALKLEAPGFANVVLDCASQVSEEHGLVLRDEVINAMYNRTGSLKSEAGGARSSGKMLRRWIVDEWVWQFDVENVFDLEWESNRSLTKEFLFDVVKAQARRLGKGAQVS